MKKRIAVIAMAALAAMLLCGCRFNMISIGGSGYRYDGSDKYLTGGGEVAAQISTLDIGWLSGSVEIVNYDGDTVRFSENNTEGLKEELLMRYWLDRGTLHIRFCKSGVLNLSDIKKDLTVWLPRDAMPERIETDTVAANIRVEGLSKAEVSLDAVSGNVTVSDCSFEDGFKADTTSGNVRLVNSRIRDGDIGTTSGNVTVSDCSCKYGFKVDTTSGDVRIVNSKFRDVDIDTLSGKLTMEDCTVTQALELETTSGGINAALLGAVGSVEIDSRSGDVTLSCGGAEDFDADTTSGDIVLHFAAMPEKGSINSSSGSVELGLPEGGDFSIDFDTTSGSFRSELPMTADGNTYTFGKGGTRYTIGTTSGSVRIVRAA